MKNLAFILTIPALLMACDLGKKDKAENECITYYYEIINDDSQNYPPENILELSNLLEESKYIFTPGSAKEYPYFKAFDLEEIIPTDSILFPHRYAHKFTRIENFKGSETQDLSSKALIILNAKDEYGRANIDMKLYKWESDKWVRHVDTGNHIIPIEKNMNKEQLLEALYKTIVRYSFK